MAQFFKNNFPVETEEAKRFWASQHKCNKMKAIIAFSTDLENANINLKRHGYSYHWRKKALQSFQQFVNQPDMKNVPFTPMSVPWWECMSHSTDTNPHAWHDSSNWDDTSVITDGANSGGTGPVDPTHVVITGSGVASGITNHVRGGDTLQLTATVLPAGSPQSVVWTTSDSQVATVSSTGLVTFVNTNDSVTIHATTLSNSISASLVFSVTASPVSITVTGSGVDVSTVNSVTIGSTLKLSASILPAEASQDIVWTSSNPSVATVSNTGLVTFTNVGGVVNISAAAFANAVIKRSVSFKAVVVATNLMPVDAFDETFFVSSKLLTIAGADAVGRTGSIGRVYETDYGGFDHIDVDGLTVGQTYTYSFYSKNGTLSWVDWGILNPTSLTWVHSTSFDIESDDWKRTSYTFTAPAALLTFHAVQNGYGDTYACCFMLEEGDTASPFSPV